MQLLIEKNFEWFNSDEVYVKGHFFYGEKFYENKEMVEFFQSVDNYSDFLMKIKSLNGCFSVIIQKQESIYAAVDRTASFPLFYNNEGVEISDSAEDLKKQLKLSNKDLDPVSISELTASGFVHGRRTVFNKVSQLMPGQALELKDNQISTNFYFKHLQVKESKNFEREIEEFSKISSRMFDRLIESLNGRTVILPLSGGYDSRFIACMLKSKGYKNVFCYTYGQIGSYEVETSKLVAKRLGYEWHNVTYDAELWSKTLNDNKTLKYAENSHNYSTMPHFQDYPALEYLSRKNILPKNGVVVTGFCGDLPAGSFVLSEEDEEYIEYNLDWVANYIFKENYQFNNLPENLKKEIILRIKDYLAQTGVEVNDFDSFTSVYEEWFTNGRPLKWVVNSNRVYEFFGLQWRMPLWDNEFLDFFYSLRTEMRRDSYFYKKYLFSKVFSLYDLEIEKPSKIKTRNIAYQKSVKRYIRRSIYNILVKISFKTGWSSWNYYDVNNYSKAAIILYNKLNNKSLFNFKNINFHQMNALWWSEKISSPKLLKEILKK